MVNGKSGAVQDNGKRFYMPSIDEWISARTKPEGRGTCAEFWRDWKSFVGDPDEKGVALGWRIKSMGIALRSRGYESRKSGARYVFGLSLRPAGELAPSAPAGGGAPVARASQDAGTGGGNVL